MGVVFRVGADLHWLPASVALKVMPAPDIARVPGAPEGIAGVALVDGETLPVVAVGPSARARGAMLVLAHHGERLAIVGVDVLATGRFERKDDGVPFGDHVARPFDVAAVVAKIEAARWVV